MDIQPTPPTRGRLAGVRATLSKLSRSTMISERGEDPWVIFWEGNYYYCRDYDDCKIMVNKGRRLEDIGQDNHIVWEDPVGNSDAEVWAPELHRIDGTWYIYFTRGKDENHRMYVLEGLSDDPQGEYVFRGQMEEPSNQWAIDTTVFQWQGKWYCAWSGWETPTNKIQNLYIAPMSSPMQISGERVCISRPVYEWEKQGDGIWPHINEGPQALEHNGKMFIIYSASHSLTDDYCLGQLALVGDDPLLPTSWVKHPRPVFHKDGTVYGPGHASFIEKPDGTDWIVYHSTKVSNGGWDARLLRAQQFHWNADGSPNFGKPRLTKATRITEVFQRYRSKLQPKNH
jgi:GH43 family beta-xylosidase